MMRFFVFCMVGLSFGKTAAQNVNLKPSVLANGASFMNNTAIVLKGTVGQTIIGTTQLPTLRHSQGFWSAASSINRIVTSHQELLKIVQQVKLYPNPANTNVRLEYQLIKEMNASLEIKDVLGRTVRMYPQEKLKAGHVFRIIDVSTLAMGQYYLYIRSAEGILAMPVQVWR